MGKAWIVGLVVLLTAGTYLVVQAMSTKTSTVFTPEQLNKEAKDKVLERVRLIGRVTGDTPIQYEVKPAALLQFSVVNPGASTGTSVPVVYRGLKPDMFVAGRDVIMDGRYEHGTFVAVTLLTQCPSKYEPPDPAKVSY